MFVTIARAVGAVLDVVLAEAARGAESAVGSFFGKLRTWLVDGAWRDARGSSDGARGVLRRAGVMGQGGRAPLAPHPKPELELPTILIIERDPLKRSYIERLCREHGHAVRAHADPEAAREAVRDDGPSLILLGGSFTAALAVCRRLVAREDRGAAVVVVVDWEGGADHERAARAVGADDYLDAPADVDWLRLRLAAVAARVRRRAVAREAAARHEAMWADLGRRVAAAYAEQQATAATLRRAIGEWSSAEEAIRHALAALGRQVAAEAGRVRAVEDAVAALAAGPRHGGERGEQSAQSAAAPRRRGGFSGREIRIPIDAVPSVGERDRLRLVKAASGEDGGVTAPSPVPAGAQSLLGDPAAGGEAGERSVAGVPFALRGAVRTALEPLRRRAQQKKIGFGCHIAADVPEGVVGDGGRVAQLLVHVVGHAIRATDQGEVRVSICLGAHASPALVLLGSVADSSPGLSPEEQERLFDALGTEDGPVRNVSSAAGLSLAAHLARSMDGRLWFESELDHGTTVRFAMRLGVRGGAGGGDVEVGAAMDRPQPAPRRALGGAPPAPSVLVVDEGPEDRLAAVRALEPRGHRVTAAARAQDALAALAATSFDAVLLDLRLCKMDGFELAAVLRALEGRNARRRLPIIAVSAMLLAGDLERCAAVGIDACLPKPLDADDLLGTIERLLSHAWRHSVPETA